MNEFPETSSQPSIFSKIIAGDIPCDKVYEDESTIAFLDISPVNSGHTLVVPKKQVEFVWDLEEDDYNALMTTVKKVAQRIREVTGKPYVGELVIGTDVPHAHVHLIPFEHATELKAAYDGRRPQGNAQEMADIAEKLRF